MRKITKFLETVTTSVDAYGAGRRAFEEGVSLTDLPSSNWDLQRSGFLDAMADAVQAIQRKLKLDEEAGFSPTKFIEG